MVSLYDIKLQLTLAGGINFIIGSSEEVEDMKTKKPEYAVVEERLVKDIEDSLKIYMFNVKRISRGEEIV